MDKHKYWESVRYKAPSFDIWHNWNGRIKEMKVDKLQNLDVRDGDVLVCHTNDSGKYTHGGHYAVRYGGRIVADAGDMVYETNATFHIRTRAPREWQDMTEQEQNEIAGHWVRGGEVEWSMFGEKWDVIDKIFFYNCLFYRIKQSPVVKTMLIDVVDGEPDMDTLREVDG